MIIKSCRLYTIYRVIYINDQCILIHDYSYPYINLDTHTIHGANVSNTIVTSATFPLLEPWWHVCWSWALLASCLASWEARITSLESHTFFCHVVFWSVHTYIYIGIYLYTYKCVDTLYMCSYIQYVHIHIHIKVVRPWGL